MPQPPRNAPSINPLAIAILGVGAEFLALLVFLDLWDALR